MNIHLSRVLSDVTSVTGQAIIRAIVTGERDPHNLAALRHYRCTKDQDEIAKALTGTWRAEHRFVLTQSLAMDDVYTHHIEACDTVHPNEDGCKDDVPPSVPAQRTLHSKNAPQGCIIRTHLKRICGVDVTAIHGVGDVLAQEMVMETGTDMSNVPNEQHVCSWLGLAPTNEISGGKVLRSATLTTRNCAG